MNVTIAGRRYDTDNAELIGCTFAGKWDVEIDDFYVQLEARIEVDSSHWDAALFRTPRKGFYFLYGIGGAMTIFKGYTRIIPLSIYQARAWAKGYLQHINPLPENLKG